MFLDVSGMAAAILPRIVAVGDVDEDEIAFAQAMSAHSAPGPGGSLPEGSRNYPQILGSV
jgi:hypothetical protein